MRKECEDVLGTGEIYLAGERVAPGNYKQIDGHRRICLDHEDVLPASLDGRVACYERLQYTWGATGPQHPARPRPS